MVFQLRGFQISVEKVFNNLLRRSSPSEVSSSSNLEQIEVSDSFPSLETLPTSKSLGDVSYLCPGEIREPGGDSGDFSRKDRVIFTHIRQPFLFAKPKKLPTLGESGNRREAEPPSRSISLTSKAEFRKRHQRVFCEETVEHFNDEDLRRFRKVLDYSGSQASERFRRVRDELVNQVSLCPKILPSVHVSLALQDK